MENIKLQNFEEKTEEKIIRTYGQVNKFLDLILKAQFTKGKTENWSHQN